MTCPWAVGRDRAASSFAAAVAAPFSVVAQQAYPPNGSAFPTVTLTGSPANHVPAPNPPNQQSTWNTELAGHDDLQGRSAYQPLIVNQNGGSGKTARSNLDELKKSL